MKEASKTLNFRFSPGEIIILDCVREEMCKERRAFYQWNRLTRTDVVKFLIRKKWAEIQKFYEEKKCRELEKATEPTKKNNRKNKAAKA